MDHCLATAGFDATPLWLGAVMLTTGLLALLIVGRRGCGAAALVLAVGLAIGGAAGAQLAAPPAASAASCEPGAAPPPAAPTGTGPIGTAPTSTAPTSTAPTSTTPSSTTPTGTTPSSTTPTGTAPTSTTPTGTAPTSTTPTGTTPTGTAPTSTTPTSTTPTQTCTPVGLPAGSWRYDQSPPTTLTPRTIRSITLATDQERDALLSAHPEVRFPTAIEVFLPDGTAIKGAVVGNAFVPEAPFAADPARVLVRVAYFDGCGDATLSPTPGGPSNPDACFDGDGADSNGNGIPDCAEGCNAVNDKRNDLDTDADGIPDGCDADSDNDGIPDSAEDAGHNGKFQDDDLEGDKLYVDSLGDGIPNYVDLDSDNDGLLDLAESGIPAAVLDLIDADGDGIIDKGVEVGLNGLADVLETTPDSGIQKYPVLDTNRDGTPDFLALRSNGRDYDLYVIGKAALDDYGAGFLNVSADWDKDGIMDPVDTDGIRRGAPGSPRSPYAP